MEDKINEAALEYIKNSIFVDETGDDESLIPNMRLMSFHAGARFVLDAIKTSRREELFKQVAVGMIRYCADYVEPHFDVDLEAVADLTTEILKSAKEFGAKE